MLIFDQPYALLLIASVIIPAILAITILRQPSNLGTRSFAALMSGVSLWAFFSLIEVCSLNVETKIFNFSFKFIFIVSVPLSWLIFSLYYANLLRVLRVSKLALLALPQMITLMMVATNPMHHLMFTSFEVVTVGNHFLLYPQWGPWFWVHATYCYLILSAGFILLAKHLIASPSHYRRPVLSLLIGGSAPWISNIIFTAKIGVMTYFDLTPTAFIISGLAFMWGILRYRMLDIVPIARDNVLQNMNDGVVVLDHELHILDLNSAATRLIGVETRNLIGSKASQVISWWPKLKTVADLDSDAFLPIIELDREGQTRFLRPLQSSLYNKDKLLGYLITLRDVTAQLMAERALRHSEERFKSFSENAPVIIFALDHSSAITYVNRAWHNTLGLPVSAVAGRNFAEFIAPEEREVCAKTFSKLIDSQQSTAELNLHLPHRDGSPRLFSISVTTNADAEGRKIGILGLAKDVTTERRLHEQLAQSQKMEAVGTLAGGVAHDFNNLLMGMQANISLIRLEVDSNTPVAKKLSRIEDQIQSGATLTRQLLGYARKGKYSVAALDINRLIEEALHVVQRANKNITTLCRNNEKRAYIKADKGQIELVLLNLFLNATDAMPEGGTLSVNTRLIPGDDLTLRWPEMEPGPHVELTINDTGIGMDASILKRIFEPFFTTKEMGRGTGLGLASVYGMVQNHYGNIQVNSRPKEGTTFTLLFPALLEVEPPKHVEEPPMGMANSGGNLLLVEDEPLILKYCREMIQSLGYHVVATNSGSSAIAIYEKESNAIDLVILDMVMPGMDGWQTYQALKRINPEIKVVITSGYAEDSRFDAILSHGCNRSLKKPYTLKELGNIIAETINPAEASPRQPQTEAY